LHDFLKRDQTWTCSRLAPADPVRRGEPQEAREPG